MKKKLIDINNLLKKELPEIFPITVRTVHDWAETGCPRNKNGKYCLKDVIVWREGKLKENGNGSSSDKQELEKEKLQQQIEKLILDNKKTKLETIPIEEVQQINRNQIRELILFFTEGYKRNAVAMMSEIKKIRSQSALLRFMDTYFKAAFDAFVESGKEYEDQ